MKLSIIVAMAENGVIGRDNELPWRLPADLRRFREVTMGHAVVMGRRTFESIGRLLPGRDMIVVTRNRHWTFDGLRVAHSLAEALALASLPGQGPGETDRELPEKPAEGPSDEVFVIGGAELFREALPRAERMYLTLVHAEVEGDVEFPTEGLDNWSLLSEETHDADERNEYPYSFRVYERRESHDDE